MALASLPLLSWPGIGISTSAFMSWHWHLYLCFHVLALPPSRGRFMSWPSHHPMWAEIDAPLRLHCAYTHTELLANAPLAAALCLHTHRACGNASAAAAALCLHAHRACGNARQLFYGIPKATCHVTSGVTSGTLLGCAPPVPTALVGRNRWCRLPPRKCAAAAALCLPTRTPSFWQCQATVLWDPEGNVPGNVTVTSGILLGCTPPRSDCSCGQK